MAVKSFKENKLSREDVVSYLEIIRLDSMMTATVVTLQKTSQYINSSRTNRDRNSKEPSIRILKNEAAKMTRYRVNMKVTKYENGFWKGGRIPMEIRRLYRLYLLPSCKKYMRNAMNIVFAQLSNSGKTFLIVSLGPMMDLIKFRY